MSRHWAPKTEGNLLDSYGITMGLMFLHCDCCRSDFFYIISRWVKFPSLDPKRVLKSRLTWGHKLAADFKETRSAPFNLQKLGFSCLPLLVTARSTTDLIVKELCPGCTSAFFATPKGLFQHQLRWLPIPGMDLVGCFVLIDVGDCAGIPCSFILGKHSNFKINQYAKKVLEHVHGSRVTSHATMPERLAISVTKLKFS